MARGAGFGQAVAFGDGGPGARTPVLHRRFVQGIGAGDQHFQPFPIDLAGVLVVFEVFVQRRHAVEHRGLVLFHRLEDALGVGGGEQHQRLPLDQTVQHQNHLAVDMEKRQECDDHFLAFLEARKRGLAGDLGRNQIVVRKHHALRIAGGAARIRQRRDVGPGVDVDRGYARARLRQQLLQLMHVGALGNVRRAYLDVAEDLAEKSLAQKFLQPRQVFAHVGDDDVVQRRAGFLHLVEQNVLANHHARAAVLQLELDFVAGIDRTDRGDGAAEFEHRKICDDELRTVQQIEADAVALFQAEPGERAGEAVGQFAQFAEADLAPVEHQRGLRAVLGGCFVEGLRHRFQRHLGIGGYAGLVEFQPRPGQVNRLGIHGLLGQATPLRLCISARGVRFEVSPILPCARSAGKRKCS